MLTFKNFIEEAIDEKKSAIDHHNKIAEILKRDCQPWINEAGGHLAWRGISSPSHSSGYMRAVFGEGDRYGFNDFIIGSVRTDRAPKDSPAWLHNALNAHLKKRTGIPLRSSSVFCSGDSMLAGNYGHVYAIFPIGDFNYAWSELVADPTHTFYIGPFGEGELPRSGDGLNKMIEKQFKAFAKEKNLYTDSVHKAIEMMGDSFSDDSDKMENIWTKFCEKFIAENELWKYNTGLKTALTKFKEHEIMIVCEKYYLVEFNTVNDYRIKKFLK